MKNKGIGIREQLDHTKKTYYGRPPINASDIEAMIAIKKEQERKMWFGEASKEVRLATAILELETYYEVMTLEDLMRIKETLDKAIQNLSVDITIDI